MLMCREKGVSTEGDAENIEIISGLRYQMRQKNGISGHR